MNSMTPPLQKIDSAINENDKKESQHFVGQRIVFTSPGSVTLEEFSIRRPGPYEVLVQTLVSIISPGTERAFLFAEPNTKTFETGFPFYPGYSSVGRVLEVGDAVSCVHVGQLLGLMTAHQSHVVVRPPLESPQQRGLGSLFDSVELTGMSWSLPAYLDSDMLQQAAAFVIATVGLYGAAQAKIQFGDEVVVAGLGPVGLFSGQFAKLSGALSVIGIAQTEERRNVAIRIGFDQAYETFDQLVQARSSSRPAQRTIVIEATGRPSNVLAALRFCPPGATLLLLGSSRGSVPDVDFYSLVHRKALNLIGAHQPTRPNGDYLHRLWSMYWDADTALNMISKRRIDAKHMISHTFSINQMHEAYATMNDSLNSLGIAILWDAN